MTSPLRVLLVDDDEMQIELLKRALAYEDVELDGIPSLSDVATSLAKGSFGCVLLDASVLGPEPRASVKIVRTFAPPGTLVVLLSAADEGKLRRVALECEMDGWLSKSVPVPDMAKRLRELTTKKG